MDKISKKICLVGDFSVGKTSLIRRFVDRQFSDRYLSTVGVKISRKEIELAEKSIKLLIWDIEGQTKFKAISSSYLQGAKGAIIVGDLTRPDTLEHLTNHLDSFFSVNPKGYAIVALNKSDLVSTTEIEEVLANNEFAQNPQIISTHVTSAKTGQEVDDIFQKLALQLL